MYKLTDTTLIIRLTDGAFIPADTTNRDYAEYQQWLSEGNTPESADQINPNISILAQITALEQKVTNRRLREALISNDFTFIQDIDSQITALSASLI